MLRYIQGLIYKVTNHDNINKTYTVRLTSEPNFIVFLIAHAVVSGRGLHSVNVIMPCQIVYKIPFIYCNCSWSDNGFVINFSCLVRILGFKMLL